MTWVAITSASFRLVDPRLSGVMLTSIALWHAKPCLASITLCRREPPLVPLGP
jgi:hypothetical protein